MSTLQVTNIKKTGETASRDVSGVAAAWVNWTSLPATTTNDSFNVSSLTDNATGSFDVNYSNSFNTANYSTSGNQAFNTDISAFIYLVQPRSSGTVLVGSCGVYTKNVGASVSGIGDYYFNCLTAHGGLA